ncbi:MAG: hypothetical protein E7047_08095 [Lentisphaerae bacterium]|nr:hypothetical protein [Lentisphaerota bacterium]
MSYKAGDIIDEYKLLSECGSGAYGTVFLAENQITTRRLALKIVYKNNCTSERELKGLQQYQIISENTNLLQIYRVKEYDDFFYYTMDAADNLITPDEYIPDTLGNRLKNGPLPPESVRKMAADLQENLQELHNKGLFHRDIKPDNILFINNRAILGDIGLVTDSAMTILAGTPGFMPSEVLAGIRSYEAADDYYALGKVIYCALTGAPVNNYPSLPDTCNINNSGDLIKLYNKYCSGLKPQPVQAAQPAAVPAKRWHRAVPYAAMLALIIAFVVIEVDLPGTFNSAPATPAEARPLPEKNQKTLRKTNAQAPARPAAQPEVKPVQSAAQPEVKPAPQPAAKPTAQLPDRVTEKKFLPPGPPEARKQSMDRKLVIRQQKCNERLQELLLEDAPSPVMVKIYPELQKIYYEKVAVKLQRGIKLSKDEELLASYFAKEIQLTELFENIKLSIENQGRFPNKTQQQLTELQRERRNLEKFLTKKYTR